MTAHRVLVVDDSDVDRVLIRGLLEAAGGIAVAESASPADALERLASLDVDLLVTDLVLPGMNGIELCAEVRARHPALPIVLVTSRGSEETAIRALRAGASSYVSKPLLHVHLLDVARPLLEAAGARRGLRQALGISPIRIRVVSGASAAISSSV